MNHGFTVDADTLPKGVSETHVSLFDGTNCGIAVDGKPVYSVQYHPEASPGPQDSFLPVRTLRRSDEGPPRRLKRTINAPGARLGALSLTRSQERAQVTARSWGINSFRP
jgi:GMP synthase-like glutamine amidotransferase